MIQWKSAAYHPHIIVLSISIVPDWLESIVGAMRCDADAQMCVIIFECSAYHVALPKSNVDIWKTNPLFCIINSLRYAHCSLYYIICGSRFVSVLLQVNTRRTCGMEINNLSLSRSTSYVSTIQHIHTFQSHRILKYALRRNVQVIAALAFWYIEQYCMMHILFKHLITMRHTNVRTIDSHVVYITSGAGWRMPVRYGGTVITAFARNHNKTLNTHSIRATRARTHCHEPARITKAKPPRPQRGPRVYSSVARRRRRRRR